MFNDSQRAAIRTAARDHARAGNDAKAMMALSPLLLDIAQQVAKFNCSCFEEASWHDLDFTPMFVAWREAIVALQQSPALDLHPGQAGVAAMLDSILSHNLDMPLLRDRERSVMYGEQPAVQAIARTAQSVWRQASAEHRRDRQADMCSSVEQMVESIWYEEALARGIPGVIHRELCFVPHWDGDDVDNMIYTHALRGTRWRGCYFDEIVPSKSLAQLLRWVNVSSKDLVAAVVATRAADGAKFAARLGKWTVKADPKRPALIAVDDLVEIIENAGTDIPVPMAHVEVDVGALMRLDPRKPILLDLDGRAHIGMHDVVNGSGHMDLYKTSGPVVIPPLASGYGWVGRWSYGIDATYGIVKHPFKCAPTNPPEAAAPAASRVPEAEPA